MTLAELIAARKALHARHIDAIAAYHAEIGRLDAAIDAAERAKLRVRVERRMQTWPPHVLDLLRQPSPPRRYSTDWSPLFRRGLVREPYGRYPERWTTVAEIAREILGVTA